MDHSNRNLAFHPKSVAPHAAQSEFHGVKPEAVHIAQGRIGGAAEILEVLRRGERFLVCSHARPDGDAIGSMLAVKMLLEEMGKRADLVTADAIPKVHRELPGAEAIRTAGNVEGSYDAAILLECDGLERSRILGLEQYYLINIDHHASGRAYGNLNWIDRNAASVGELVYRLVKAAGARVTPAMATCLYTTLVTDTGGFCMGGTQASTFALARELVEAGADPLGIAQKLYFSTPASKILLLGAALGKLKHEGRLAWLWVTRQEMAQARATEEECEGIVNFALCVSGVEAAVFLYELPEERIQLSLRSKGRVNVAAIAEQLGGGGHMSASGCTLKGPLERALEEVLIHLRHGVAGLAEEAG
jgi:phosphoesterase RecJ-like protein